MKGLVFFLCALALFGCTSVKTLTDCRGVRVEAGQTPVGVVDVYNTNWLLLSLLPIASGGRRSSSAIR